MIAMASSNILFYPSRNRILLSTVFLLCFEKIESYSKTIVSIPWVGSLELPSLLLALLSFYTVTVNPIQLEMELAKYLSLLCTFFGTDDKNYVFNLLKN